MVSRKARAPRRYEGGDEEGHKARDQMQERRESGMTTRRASTGRMVTRSDIVVEKMPNQGQTVDANDDITNKGRDRSKSVSAQQPTLQSQTLLERRVTLDPSALKQRKESETSTPARSINGSVSGTISTPRTHRINTRSKGTFIRIYLFNSRILTFRIRTIDIFRLVI